MRTTGLNPIIGDGCSYVVLLWLFTSESAEAHDPPTAIPLSVIISATLPFMLYSPIELGANDCVGTV